MIPRKPRDVQTKTITVKLFQKSFETTVLLTIWLSAGPRKFT